MLVDPDPSAAAVNQHALVQAGYRVAPATSFEEAIRQLDNADLLVTKVRLGAFNGLHLLLRYRVNHPGAPVIVLGTSDDHTADMGHFGAQFVTTPIEHASFLELIAGLLSGGAPSDPPIDALDEDKSHSCSNLIS